MIKVEQFAFTFFEEKIFFVQNAKYYIMSILVGNEFLLG